MLETPFQRRREAENVLRLGPISAVDLAQRIGVTARTARRILCELSCFLPVTEENHRYTIVDYHKQTHSR